MLTNTDKCWQKLTNRRFCGGWGVVLWSRCRQAFESLAAESPGRQVRIGLRSFFSLVPCFLSRPKFSGSEQASLGINCGRRLIPSSFVVSKVILMDLFDFTFCNTLISINNSLSSEWILYMISTGVDPNLENSGTAVWAGTREAAFMANVKSTFRWFLQKTTFSLGSPGCLFVTMPKMAQYTGK